MIRSNRRKLLATFAIVAAWACNLPLVTSSPTSTPPPAVAEGTPSPLPATAPLASSTPPRARAGGYEATRSARQTDAPRPSRTPVLIQTLRAGRTPLATRTLTFILPTLPSSFPTRPAILPTLPGIFPRP